MICIDLHLNIYVWIKKSLLFPDIYQQTIVAETNKATIMFDENSSAENCTMYFASGSAVIDQTIIISVKTLKKFQHFWCTPLWNIDLSWLTDIDCFKAGLLELVGCPVCACLYLPTQTSIAYFSKFMTLVLKALFV